jgi:hypothetical protein
MKTADEKYSLEGLVAVDEAFFPDVPEQGYLYEFEIVPADSPDNGCIRRLGTASRSF